MKRAFTLVELLIVIVVIATLMSIIFRLSSIGGENEARNKTVVRMQKLENCISGYYAAFGSYPPVKVHGSRNIYYPTNRRYKLQLTDQDPQPGVFDVDRIQSACASQPVSVNFPYPKDFHGYVASVSKMLTEFYNAGVEPYCNNPVLAKLFDALEDPSNLNAKRNEILWNKCQLFRFGLLSYLLPRYLVMMGHDDSNIYDNFRQWNRNNDLPCRFEDGSRFSSWSELNSYLQPKKENGEKKKNPNRWKVEALPSQAVTARWLPNLEGQLTFEESIPEVKGAGHLVLYGIDVAASSNDRDSSLNIRVANSKPKLFPVTRPTGEDDVMGNVYALDGLTCNDGWGNELFYYSPPPYQSYRLWSAGPNGLTFPPWISADEIGRDSTLNGHRKEIMEWMSDDIVHLSN